MPNTFFTVADISKEFVRIMENELVLGRAVGTDTLENEKTKSGGVVQVRRQMQYLGQDNNLNLSAYEEDIIDGNVTVTLDQTWSNKVSVGAIDRTLSFDRYSRQIIEPMAKRAAERIESSIAALYSQFYWFDGTPGTIPSTFASIANAGAIMTDAGNMVNGRLGFHSPACAAALSANIQGTFVNDNNKKALENAIVGQYAGFLNYQSAFVPTHTVGPLGGTPLVNGAAQSTTYLLARNTWTQTLVTDGWTAAAALRLRAGDIIRIANVFAVSPTTKQSTGRLQTFTVMADASSDASGNATLTISPPMIVSGAFQTVSAAPADNAAITVVTGSASTAYRQSLLIDPQAIALVSRPLDIPSGEGLKTSTITGNNVTVSVSSWVDGNTLNESMRFDMLWKPVVLDPRRGMRLTN